MSLSETLHFDELPDVLTVEECAAYLHLHPKTICAYVREGRLRAARCGKYYRVHKEWVRAFLDRESR